MSAKQKRKEPVAELTLANLPFLDLGRIDMALVAELSPLIRDCLDRPHEKTPRNCDMRFKLTPVPEGDDEVNVEVEMSGKRPKRVTKTYTMRAKRKPGPDNEYVLLFNRDSADISPDGSPTILDEIRKNEGEDE